VEKVKIHEGECETKSNVVKSFLYTLQLEESTRYRSSGSFSDSSDSNNDEAIT
jgi:hypothetical protein